MSFHIPRFTVRGLQPHGLYEGQALEFGQVNYFIGKNGTGKTQLLTKLHESMTSYASNNNPNDYIFKFLTVQRAQTLAGSRDFLTDRFCVWDSARGSAEGFYQLLNESPLTKSIVRDRLEHYFRRTIDIKTTARSIHMDILGGWNDAGKGKTSVSLGSESDGLKELMVLLTYIYHPSVKVLALDEIGLHLHPQMITFVVDAIEEAVHSSDKQFFLATHSPIAIRIVPESTWKYFFFNGEKGQIRAFDQFNDPCVKHLIPQLNSFRREIFYSDRIVLVEGEQDYQILHALARRLGYSEAEGYSFLPCWGAWEFEKVYKLIRDLEKEARIIADANIDGFANKFSTEFARIITNPDITSRLSVDDIVHLCKEKDRLFPGKNSFGSDQKREIVREELNRINSDRFREEDFSELIAIVRKVLGEPHRHILTDEFYEMCKELVGGVQLRMASEGCKSLLAQGNENGIVEELFKDQKLNKVLRDLDRRNFRVAIRAGAWTCEAVFKCGNLSVRSVFDKTTDHAEFYPEVISAV